MQRTQHNLGFFLSALLGLWFLATLVHAASNSVPIGLTVNTDVSAPSQPAGLTATAISSSQIDLSWSASTDNVAVSGYVVRRGGSILASTSLTTYSDTGLTASTLYSYTVTAYDAAFNYSVASLPASATTSAAGGSSGGGDVTPPTLAATTPVAGATGVSVSTQLTLTLSEPIRAQVGSLTVRRLSDGVLVQSLPVAGASLAGNSATFTLGSPLAESTSYYVEVPGNAFDDTAGNFFAGISGTSTWYFTTPDLTAPVISGATATSTYGTSTITWNTNELAKGVLSLGTTTDYALASAAEVTFVLSHGMVLGGLSPGTHYYFRITAVDLSGNSSFTTGEFTTPTLPVVDLTPPANVSNLTATPTTGKITLDWTNPNDADFAAVRVMRSTTMYPLDQNDGVVVYDGSGTTVDDTAVVDNVTYYYTVFTRDTVNNYSSGSVVQAKITPPPPPPPPPPATTTPPTNPGTPENPPAPGTEPPPTTPGTPSGSGGTSPVSGTTTIDLTTPYATSSIPLPFTNLQPIENLPTQLRELGLGDFDFVELGVISHTLPVIGDSIRLNGDRGLRVSIVAEKVPSVLKTIAVTIADPKDPKKATTVLLRLNPTHTAYEGVFDPLRKQGDFPLIISVVDHANKGAKLISGIVHVYLSEEVVATSTPVARVVEQVTNAIQQIEEPIRAISPVTAPAGIAIGATQAVLLVTNVQSFADIYLLIIRIISAIAGLFRRKKTQQWGVVYDSVTKRPLDPAYVIARGSDQKSKGEAITDLDGRYGFVLEPGEYIIQANKTHYKFPSAKLAGKSRDELYDNLYFGNNFKLGKDQVVQYNIPLDPIEFDWNEYAKVQDKVFKVYSRRDHLRVAVFNFLYYLGFAFSVFSFATHPKLLNGLIVLVYIGISVFQMFWKHKHRINRVLRRTTGNPIPFALVKVYMPGLGTVVKKTVADELGRYYFLVPPGKYIVAVEEKLPDESYREVLRTQELDLQNGVMAEDLVVG